MKVGIVYYSRSGTTEGLAGQMAKVVRDAGNEVRMVPIKHRKRPGFLGAGRASMEGKEMEIVNEPGDFDLTWADTIVVGGPIFAGRVNPFMKTFLDRARGLEGKTAGVYICCSTPVDGASDYVQQMRQLVEGYGLRVKAEMIGSRKVKGEYDRLARTFVLDLLDVAPAEIGGEGDDAGDGGGDGGNGE